MVGSARMNRGSRAVASMRLQPAISPITAPRRPVATSTKSPLRRALSTGHSPPPSQHITPMSTRAPCGDPDADVIPDNPQIIAEADEGPLLDTPVIHAHVCRIAHREQTEERDQHYGGRDKEVSRQGLMRSPPDTGQTFPCAGEYRGGAVGQPIDRRLEGAVYMGMRHGRHRFIATRPLHSGVLQSG